MTSLFANKSGELQPTDELCEEKELLFLRTVESNVYNMYCSAFFLSPEIFLHSDGESFRSSFT